MLYDTAAIEAFAAGARAILDGEPLEAATHGHRRAAAAAAAHSDVAIVARRACARGELEARAVYARAAAVAAELEGSRLRSPTSAARGSRAFALPGTSSPAALAARGAAARAACRPRLPVAWTDGPRGTLELYSRTDDCRRAGVGAGAARRRPSGRLPAACRRHWEGTGTVGRPGLGLELIGEALAAGADEARRPSRSSVSPSSPPARRAPLLWRVEPDGPPASSRPTAGRAPPGLAGSGPHRVGCGRAARTSPSVEPDPMTSIVMPLGEPPAGALQLYLRRPRRRGRVETSRAFAARAARGSSPGRRAAWSQDALRRSQTVIGVVSQAIAQLSLAHTLETAVERIGRADRRAARSPSTCARANG